MTTEFNVEHYNFSYVGKLLTFDINVYLNME